MMTQIFVKIYTLNQIKPEQRPARSNHQHVKQSLRNEGSFPSSQTSVVDNFDNVVSLLS